MMTITYSYDPEPLIIAKHGSKFKPHMEELSGRGGWYFSPKQGNLLVLWTSSALYLRPQPLEDILTGTLPGMQGMCPWILCSSPSIHLTFLFTNRAFQASQESPFVIQSSLARLHWGLFHRALKGRGWGSRFWIMPACRIRAIVRQQMWGWRLGPIIWAVTTAGCYCQGSVDQKAKGSEWGWSFCWLCGQWGQRKFYQLAPHNCGGGRVGGALCLLFFIVTQKRELGTTEKAVIHTTAYCLFCWILSLSCL